MQNTDASARLRLRRAVAEAVRVECARRGISHAELARQIGKQSAYISRRMTSDTAFDLDDLALIAGALGVSPTDLLPAVERAA